MSSSNQSNEGAYEGTKPVPRGITRKVFIAFLLAAALLTIFSIWIIAGITHDLYVASYYSLEALFDVNPFAAGTTILSEVLPFSSSFYPLYVVSVLDGIAKVVIIGFLLATLTNFLRGINITSKIRNATLGRLKDHVIICGYSMLAERLCQELKGRSIPFIVIDKSPEKADLLEEMSYRVINDDFTDRKVLEEASLKSARAIVFATESDFYNLLGVVTAKHMYPDARIITRTTEEVNIGKMKRGGAQLCLVPEVVAGQELGESILKL